MTIDFVLELLNKQIEKYRKEYPTNNVAGVRRNTLIDFSDLLRKELAKKSIGKKVPL